MRSNLTAARVGTIQGPGFAAAAAGAAATVTATAVGT